jgi:hypothetical protein
MDEFVATGNLPSTEAMESVRKLSKSGLTYSFHGY